MQIKINDEWYDVSAILYKADKTRLVSCVDFCQIEEISFNEPIKTHFDSMEQPQGKSKLEILEEGLDNVCNQVDTLEKNFNALAYKVREIDNRTCAVKGLENDMKKLLDILNIDSRPAIKDAEGNIIADRTYESCTIRNLAKRVDELEEAVAKYEATKDIISQDEAFDKAGLNTIGLWISRDEDGTLNLSVDKPHKKAGFWETEDIMELNVCHRLFPSVTFENSPQKVELRLIKDNEKD
jgi:hypothetical protein